jgi:predicted nuclease of restriction endonuclease-like (RecB) superfamily
VLRVFPQDVTDVFKNTYAFGFLNLPESFSEKDLRKALIFVATKVPQFV